VPVVVVLVIAWCLGGSREIAADTMVDGWSIGAKDSCTSTHTFGASSYCQERLAVAMAGLDRRNRRHPGVVRVTMHLEGRYSDPSGKAELVLRTFSVAVAVFELRDGSIMALGVGRTGPRGLSWFDYGPGRSDHGVSRS
jgi:hypothetical protein